MKHKMRYTYARGRVRVQCSCGEAQTKWVDGNTGKPELKQLLIKAHAVVKS